MRLFKSSATSYIFFGLLSSATLVLGQQMPECAGRCLETSLKAQMTCGPTNTTCLCTTPPLLAAIQGCVLSSCTVIEALSAQNITETMCEHPVRDLTHITPIVTGVSGGAALFAVSVRVLITGSEFALDDFFAIAAFVTALPMGILEFFMAADGFGKDIWNIEAVHVYRIVRFTWLTEVLYFAALTFTKISFLFFCLRIFPRQQLRNTVYTLIALSLAHGAAFTITCLFNCTPISYIWTNWDGEHTGKCIKFNIFAWVHAATNIILDVAIIAVPIPELLRLSLSLRKKIYVIMMFSVGLFTTIVSIVRLQSLVQFATSANPTYDNVPTAYWSVLEAFVGIFCVCMPSLRRFLAHVFPSCFQSTQTGSKKYEQYSNDPNKPSYGTRKASKASISFGGLKMGSGITKTTQTTVESRKGEEDEIELVGMEGNRGRGMYKGDPWVRDPGRGSEGSRS